MLKIELKEADYKSIHKILNDTSIYNDLSIDNVNYIISEISDNLQCNFIKFHSKVLNFC